MIIGAPRACLKIAYPDATAARSAARGLSRKRDRRMHAYLCNDCGRWHLSSHAANAARFKRRDRRDR